MREPVPTNGKGGGGAVTNNLGLAVQKGPRGHDYVAYVFVFWVVSDVIM
jgi:hypothetical protein